MSETQTATSSCAGCAEWARRFADLEAKVRELEARLNQNSSNSSRPPSSDPPWQGRGRGRQGRQPGAQPGHPGHHRQRLPPEKVTRVIRHVPARCEHCEQALSPHAGPQDGAPTWFQVAELAAQPVAITEHQGHARTCPTCGHVTRQQIPAAVRAHTCGPRLTATISYLSARCRCSRRRIVEILEAVLGLPLSLGTVVQSETETSAALAPACVQILRTVRQAAAVNVDETGWYRSGQTCWLWMAACRHAVAFHIDPSRALAGLRALLGEKPANLVTSDRWHTYNTLPATQRQFCWAHLQREFQGFVERGGAAAKLGVAGLHASALVFESWRAFKAGGWDRKELQAALEPVQMGLRQDLEEARAGPKSKLTYFAGRLLAGYTALWAFGRVEGVEPTNNHAERQLRAAGLWRKSSFGAHSEAGCRFVARALSVIQTLVLQGRPVLEYLTAALHAHRAHAPAPVLL